MSTNEDMGEHEDMGQTRSDNDEDHSLIAENARTQEIDRTDACN